MNINFIDENKYKLSEAQRLTLQLIQKLISMFNLGVNFYLLVKRIKAQKKHNLISSLKLELLISCIIVSLSYFLTVGALVISKMFIIENPLCPFLPLKQSKVCLKLLK